MVKISVTDKYLFPWALFEYRFSSIIFCGIFDGIIFFSDFNILVKNETLLMCGSKIFSNILLAPDKKDMKHFLKKEIVNGYKTLTSNKKLHHRCLTWLK